MRETIGARMKVENEGENKGENGGQNEDGRKGFFLFNTRVQDIPMARPKKEKTLNTCPLPRFPRPTRF